MRKIFPLKPASRANADATRRRSGSVEDKDGAREEAAGRVRREHWCPVCPASGAHTSCATPPSGDENSASLEEIKTLVVSKYEAAELSFRHRHGLQGESRFGQKAASFFGEEIKGVVRSGPRVSGKLFLAQGNDMHAAEPQTAPVSAARAAAVSMSAQADRRGGRGKMFGLAKRSTSAPKTRQPSSTTQQQPEQQACTRHNSMRLLRVPDRVLHALDSTPQERPAARPSGSKAHDVVVLECPPSGQGSERGASTSSLCASLQQPQSEVEPESGSFLHVRSRSESEWLPVSPGVTPPKLGSAARASSNSDKPHSRYLSARTVAERLAKAIRVSTRSWSKDVKALVPPPEDAAAENPVSQAEGRSVHALAVSTSEAGAASPSTATSDSTPKAGATGSVGQGEEHMLGAQYDSSSQDNNDSSSDSRGGRSQTPESCGSKTGVERTALLAELGKSLQPHLETKHWLADLESKNRKPPWPVSPHEDDRDRLTPRQGASGRLTPRLVSVHSDEVSDRLTPRLITVHPDKCDQQEKLVSLSGSLRQSEDLEARARAAEDQVSMLAAEKALLEDQFELITEDSLEWRIKMQQRLRRMHEEKKHLAQEFASEVKRRMTERAAAKEVLCMMKKEMDSCVKVVEKEKHDAQMTLERELERRETSWGSRVDKIRVEEQWLRERLQKLEEEKGGLQNQLATVNSKENALREKVSDFEQQMDGHRKRVEGAEKTIMELRKSLQDSFKHARQTEADAELLRKACKEKEAENSDLHKLVQRLQQLCRDHETSIQGLRQGMKNATDKSDDGDTRVRRLQKELIRLSGVEQALRSELETARGESTVLRRENKGLIERLRSDQRDAAALLKKFEADYRSELDRLQSQIVELGQDNNILAGKLRVVLREREEAKDALKVSETCMKGVEEQNRSLQEDVRRERMRLQDMQKDTQEFQRLERRAESLAKQNQMLQGLISMKEKAVLVSGEEVKEKEREVREAHQTQSEMQQSLQLSARQLYIMNERAEMMASKLLERESQVAEARNECERRDEVIRGLEQNLSDLAKQVDSQNARIQRLTGNNEELFRLYHEKGREIDELQQKLLKEIEAKLECEHEVGQLKENIKELKNEVKAQELNCKLLRDKLCSRESDIEDCNKELSLLVQRRDWLQNELQQFKKLFGEATRKVEILGQQVKEKEEKIASLQVEAEAMKKELTALREEVPRITKDRDSMQQEAEEMGREALRMSAEVEVLRRKVQQLDEEVMVKEGQISILRGNYEPGES